MIVRGGRNGWRWSSFQMRKGLKISDFIRRVLPRQLKPRPTVKTKTDIFPTGHFPRHKLNIIYYARRVYKNATFILK